MSLLRREPRNPVVEGLLPLAARVVPKGCREAWLKEWRAELWHLSHGMCRGRFRVWRTGGAETAGVRPGLSLMAGMIADGIWLRCNWLQESASGSAGWCLAGQILWCILMGVADLMMAGSWSAFGSKVGAHFLNCFALVAVPALFVALATYPLRQLRWESKDARLLSARTRWTMFLAAKVLLTLALAFLGTEFLSVAMHQALGRMAGWYELMSTALVVTTSLRWALLNQERRCHHCLRVLRDPERSGPLSWNFLAWSGTELSCARGHGMLQVPQMEGSWCWYDQWVDVDAA